MIKVDVWNILKMVPRGVRLYSSVYGYVYLNRCSYFSKNKCIFVYDQNGAERCFTETGRLFRGYDSDEITLFPDREMRDWENFNPMQFPHDYFCYAADSPQGPFEIAYYSHYDYNLQRHICFGDSLPKRRATNMAAHNYIISGAKFNAKDIPGSLKFNIYNLKIKSLPL